MTISIVTPTYNGEKYLRTTVESVLAQTYTCWEHLIVDDGSTDDTVPATEDLARLDSRIRVLRKTNGGVATARNFGYANISADSEFVVFLDQDDVWKPFALEQLLNALSASPDAVAAHALTRQTDLDGNPHGAPGGTIMSKERRKVVGKKIVFCDQAEPTTFNTLICDCCIPTPGVTLIRRSAFEKIRGEDGILFDQNVASGDDWDVWLRLSLRGHFAFINEVLLDWRQHDTNGSKNEYVTFAAESKVRRKMSNWPELTAEQAKMADWRYQRIYASIERRNAKICWRWMLEASGRGDRSGSANLARTWLRTYCRYLGLRWFWNGKDRERPLPQRMLDSARTVETQQEIVSQVRSA